MKKFNKIVFICTGNTCRSPMAEGLLKHFSEDKKIKVSSRGLMVFSQIPANNSAIFVMNEQGVDITNHISKPFDKDELEDNTLVLTMTHRHKTVLTQHGFNGDVYSIKEFIGEQGDVNDPYGGDIYSYRSCANELSLIIKQLVTNI